MVRTNAMTVCFVNFRDLIVCSESSLTDEGQPDELKSDNGDNGQRNP